MPDENSDALLRSSMRDAFLDRLYEHAKKDKRIILLSNDFGAPALDRIRAELPKQYVPIGIAEQNLVNVAAGLAMEGMLPYVYSISPFIPLRCLEQMRLHVGLRGLPINFVVVGAGFTYDKSGPTHHSLEDLPILSNIPYLDVYNVSDAHLASLLADVSLRQAPMYLRFDRALHDPIYAPSEGWEHFSTGLRDFPFPSSPGTQDDLLVIATGDMVHAALDLSKQLRKDFPGRNFRVLDVFRINPLNLEAISGAIADARSVLVLEENFGLGGLGERLSSHFPTEAMRLLHVPPGLVCEYGGRQALRARAGLDETSILHAALELLKAL